MQRRSFAVGTAAVVAAPLLRAQPEQGGEIVVGQSAVLSGPVGEQLKQFVAGARMHFGSVNQAGGVNGRKLRLVSLDDQLQPARTLTNCEALIQQHRATVLFGFSGSANLLAAEPVLRKYGVPLVGAFAVSDSARARIGGSAYFLRAGYGREAERIAQQLATLGIRNVAIAYLDNPGGAEVNKILDDQLSKVGITATAAVAFAQDGSNLDPAAAHVAKVRPQAVIMFLAGSLPGKMIRALDARGFYANYYGFSIVPGETTAQVLSGKLRSLVISQVMPYPWSETDVAIKQYRAAAKAAEVPVGYTSFEGYATAAVLVEALQRAGRDSTAAKVHAAIRGLKARIAGMDINFTGGQRRGPGWSRWCTSPEMVGSFASDRPADTAIPTLML